MKYRHSINFVKNHNVLSFFRLDPSIKKFNLLFLYVVYTLQRGGARFSIVHDFTYLNYDQQCSLQATAGSSEIFYIPFIIQCNNKKCDDINSSFIELNSKGDCLM